MRVAVDFHCYSLLNFMNSKNNYYSFVLLSICCIGCAFRIYHLTAFSFFCDEMIQATTSSEGWKNMFDLMATKYCSSPPLDYVITKIVILCFGKTDWVLRMPAFLFGVAAIPVFYYFARSIAGQKTALVAAALLALSPLAISFSQEARMYPLYLFLSLISFLATLKLAQKNSFPYSLLSGASNGLVLLVHYFGIFLVAYETIFLLSAAVYGAEKKRRIELLAVSLIIAFFIFLPWFPFFLMQLKAFAGQELGFGLSTDIVFFKTMLARFTTAKWYLDAWAYAYLFVFFTSTAIAWRKKKRNILFVALGILVILGTLFCVAFYKKMVVPQYVFFLLPLFLLVCAYGITSTFDFLKMNFTLSIAISLLFVVWPALEYHRAGPLGLKQPWKDAYQYIRQHSRGNEKIFITDPADRGLLAYYADPEATYSVMKKDWSVFRNEPSWKIWVIDDAIIDTMKKKSFSGWVVAPSFIMSGTYNEYFFKNYSKVLVELLGPPVQLFNTQQGPLQLFHVQAADPQ